jgi:hypothetical protein
VTASFSCRLIGIFSNTELNTSRNLGHFAIVAGLTVVLHCLTHGDSRVTTQGAFQWVLIVERSRYFRRNVDKLLNLCTHILKKEAIPIAR